jgi:hypothetical protein
MAAKKKRRRRSPRFVTIKVLSRGKPRKKRKKSRRKGSRR